MEIIHSDEIFLCGFLVKSNGGNLWEKYEKVTAIHKQPELVDWTAYEVWFFPADTEQVFTACQQKEKVISPHYELLCIPATIWAVFNIDQKIDQAPQFEKVDIWLDENKSKYERFLWDANGRVGLSEFVICRFDHDGKYGTERIMEYWIPLVNSATV